MALPPTNPPGLVRDAEDLNKVVNGDGTTNRAGESLPSLKSILGVVEARRDSAILAIDSAQSQAQSASASAIQSIQQAEADTQGALDDAVDRIITEGEQAAASTGWFVIGDFADGFEFTARNQVGRDSTGELWSYNGSLPFTVTPATVPRSPTYTNRGDAALRSELANEGGASLVRGTVFTVDSLIGLLNAPLREGQQVSVSGFYPGSKVGGGAFELHLSHDLSTNDGGTVLAASSIQAWVDSAQLKGGLTEQNLYDSLSDLYQAPSGFGPAWVRTHSVLLANPQYESTWFGQRSEPVSDSTAALSQFSKSCPSVSTAVFKGETNISGSSVVFSNKQNIEIDLTGFKTKQQDNFSKTIQVLNCGNVRVKGGHLTGRGGAAGEFNGASTSYNGVAGLFFDTCDEVIVEQAELYDHAGGSIVHRNVSIFRTRFNKVRGIGSAFINPLDNGQDFAIGGFSDDASRMDFVYDFFGDDISGTAFGYFGNRAKTLKLHGSIIDGIPGQHGAYFIECSGLSVIGNTIKNCAQSPVKLQLENYAGRGLAPAGFENLVGFIYALNNIDNCQDGLAVISTSFSDGTPQVLKGLSTWMNAINNTTQDGMVLNRCVESSVTNNQIKNCARNGIRALNFSGKLSDNTISDTGSSGLYGSISFDSDLIGNKFIDTGLNNLAGSGQDTPILIDTPVSPITGQSANPLLNMKDTHITFTSGDAASSSVAFIADARIKLDIEGTKTNSIKSFRHSGELVRSFNNQFNLFNSGSQNNPAQFIEGKANRDFFGQLNPQEAASTNFFLAGDLHWYTNASAGGNIGAVCVTTGSPGVWKKFGGIEE